MPIRGSLTVSRWVAATVLAVGSVGTSGAQQPPGNTPASTDAPYRALVNTYCLSCHNNRTKAGSLELTSINTADLNDHWETWEKVVRKLRAHQMPPPAARQPDEAARATALASLEASLDKLSATTPNPGRTDTFRRMTRTRFRCCSRPMIKMARR